MNLKFISNRALTELRSQIDANRAGYLAGKAGNILDSLDASSILESQIVADTPRNWKCRVMLVCVMLKMFAVFSSGCIT